MLSLSPALAQLFQSLSLAGLVTLLVNLTAPFLENYVPFAKPSSGTHDATLRALNLLLNVGLAFGVAALLSQLNTGQDVLAVIGYGVAQATGSHLLYVTGNRASNAASAPASAPASASPLPAAPVDVASAVASSAASVAAAVDAAIAAQKPAA